MEKVEVLLAAIDYKSRKIIEQRNNLKDENDVLKKRIFVLESQLNATNERNRGLEENIKQINIGKTITHSEIAESKAKINKLVRKIDRCITLITSDNG
jgi:chromosome segregation ATPase